MRRLLGWGVVLTLATGGIGAQEVSLGDPVAVHPEDFALVNTVRELSDGRVLVADPLGTVLVELTPDLSGATTLAREGQGPQEYLQPDAVWPLPGDSTLLVDLGNSRLTVVSPDGSFVRTRPIQLGAFDPGAGPPALLLPGGTDGRGRIYFGGPRARGPEGPSDSVPLMRFDPATESIDTIARLKTSSLTVQTSGSAANQRVSMSPVPLSGADSWAVTPDGRVAIARVGDYRVEWIEDGRLTRGPPVDYEPVSIGGDEREEWAEGEQRNGGIGIGVTNVNGQISMTMSRSGGQRPSDLAGLPWPEAKPPFVSGTARIDGSGRLWVQRSLPAGSDHRLYDVFDGSGAHVGSVRFPRDRRLVGFGADGLYAVRIDPFDLLTLERYVIPEL